MLLFIHNAVSMTNIYFESFPGIKIKYLKNTYFLRKLKLIVLNILNKFSILI